MTTATRDPRTDPQPGDVLEMLGWRRTVTKVTKSVVHYTLSNFKHEVICGNVDRFAWRLWAKSSTVVDVAETLQDHRNG